MPAIVLDTLDYAKKLEAAGFTKEQAETQASLISNIFDEKMVTKSDLRELEYKLTIRFGGMLAVAALAALMTIIK